MKQRCQQQRSYFFYRLSLRDFGLERGDIYTFEDAFFLLAESTGVR